MGSRKQLKALRRKKRKDKQAKRHGLYLARIASRPKNVVLSSPIDSIFEYPNFYIQPPYIPFTSRWCRRIEDRLEKVNWIKEGF